MCGRSIVLLALVTAGMVHGFSSASAEDAEYTAGKALWLAQDYRGAYDILIRFRDGPYGRRPDVDYMLATSACRLQDPLRSWGRAVLEWMPSGYSLGPEGLALVQKGLSDCREAVVTRVAPQLPAATEAVSAGMRVTTKEFWWLDKAQPVVGAPSGHLRALSQSEIGSRRLARASVVDPLPRVTANIAQQGVPMMRLTRSEHFVVATSAGQTTEELAQIGNLLEGYLAFLSKRFEVLEPDFYVTAYILPDIESLQRFAAVFDGMQVGPATLGYTDMDDMSAVVVASGTAIGSLYHELFHLLARSSFGDIPLWLDEGIASLYESASNPCGEVIGEPNWRGRVLDTFWTIRPKVADLITARWASPKEPNRGAGLYLDMLSPERQATYFAEARYFMLYLQEHQDLFSVYSAFLTRPIDAADDDPRKGSVRMVEACLKDTIQAIDAGFGKWFTNTGRSEKIARPWLLCQ